MSIRLKAAQAKDCDLIAEWINSVGHGHIDYLLEGLLPDTTALQHLAKVLQQDPDYSYKNVDLVVQDQTIIGLLFSYHSDANRLKPEMLSILSEERVQWMRFFADNQISNSWYINTLGVTEQYRRQGIGRQLLDLAASRALRHGVRGLSLHVYENNLGAIKLYESYGFRKVKKIVLKEHPFFMARNLSANLLMKYDLVKKEN